MNIQTGIAAKAIDNHAAWLAGNTAFCLRMAARITVSACLENQQQSRFDNRCTGCAGLFDQETMTEVCPDLVLLRVLDEIIERAVGPKLPQRQDNSRTDTEMADDFEDIELALDDEQLLKLFPELLCQKDDDQEAVIEKRFAEYQEPVKPRMIYSGTCERCGGYVEDTRERFDDNVFRCFICGWRTSPDYEANRKIQSKGGITI